MAKKPKVSIITIAYNQEKYIEEALKSFVSQKTNFSFEIIVADDGSSDKTQSIVKKYEKQYPHLFSNILRKKNIGAIPNFKDALMHAKGDYIALCEGDDFWTNVEKLQRQVDFMESHSGYTVCFHPVRVFFENGQEKDATFPDRTNHFTIKDLLERNFIQTNSVMYRRQKDYSKLMSNVMPYDWYLHLYHAQFGKVGFINKVMSAYRRHESGMWWSSTHDDKTKFWNTHGKGYIALYDELLKIYTLPEYREAISGNIKNVYEQIKHYSLGKDNKTANEVMITHPLAAAALIERLTDEDLERRSIVQENELLRSKVVEAENRLAHIRQSKVWRLRNKLAKYIKRERL